MKMPARIIESRAHIIRPRAISTTATTASIQRSLLRRFEFAVFGICRVNGWHCAVHYGALLLFRDIPFSMTDCGVASTVMAGFVAPPRGHKASRGPVNGPQQVEASLLFGLGGLSAWRLCGLADFAFDAGSSSRPLAPRLRWEPRNASTSFPIP